MLFGLVGLALFSLFVASPDVLDQLRGDALGSLLYVMNWRLIITGQSYFSQFYASPLERTRETAAPIAKRRHLRVRIDKGLLEADFGDWTGQELKTLMKLPQWSTVQRYPSGFRFPGGESFTEMQSRMVATVERLCAAHPGGVVVAVSHADPIKALVAHAMGTHLDLFQRIVISTCSVTAIAYGAGGPVVLTVNSTGGSLAELRAS